MAPKRVKAHSTMMDTSQMRGIPAEQRVCRAATVENLVTQDEWFELEAKDIIRGGIQQHVEPQLWKALDADYDATPPHWFVSRLAQELAFAPAGMPKRAEHMLHSSASRCKHACNPSLSSAEFDVFN
eukprot:524470-Amphidinium_carterae.1